MKVATAVGIFCCLIVVTVVNGDDLTMFIALAEVTEVDGQQVITCSVEWGGVKYTVNEGDSIRLPSVGGGTCFNCQKCDIDGMACFQYYNGSPPDCPAYQSPKFH